MTRARQPTYFPTYTSTTTVPPPFTMTTNVLPSSPINTRTFAIWNGTEIPDDLMDKCATLFNNNYGVWSSKVPQRQGKHIKLNITRLRAQCVSKPEQTVLVTCIQENQLVGHAFATVWDSAVGTVGWVTQLVVDMEFRKRWIATQLLQMLKIHPLFAKVTAIRVASSHPATCTALSKYANAKIEAVDLTFCRDNARQIIEASPVDYIRNMQLRGSLFEKDCSSEAISSADTDFHIDHKEPLTALQVLKDARGWSLGELLEGHEFLIILPV